MAKKIHYRGEIEHLSGWRAVIHDLIMMNKESFDSLLDLDNLHERKLIGSECTIKKTTADIEYTTQKPSTTFENTEVQLLYDYYRYLLKTSKNIAVAAKRAGLKYETFRSKLRKLKIITKY